MEAAERRKEETSRMLLELQIEQQQLKLEVDDARADAIMAEQEAMQQCGRDEDVLHSALDVTGSETVCRCK
jgi:hypothetical protein